MLTRARRKEVVLGSSLKEAAFWWVVVWVLTHEHGAIIIRTGLGVYQLTITRNPEVDVFMLATEYLSPYTMCRQVFPGQGTHILGHLARRQWMIARDHDDPVVTLGSWRSCTAKQDSAALSPIRHSTQHPKPQP